MAIWQYSFLVVPKSFRVAGDRHSCKALDSDGLFDDESLWRKEDINISFFSPVDEILPMSSSWSNSIHLYGDQDSNRFEVYSDENGKIISVSFRVDYTSNFQSILRQVLDFVRIKDLVLLDEDLNVQESNFESIVRLIENSNSYKRFHELR